MAKFKVSSIHRFVEAFRGEEIWIGVDVHKRSYSKGILPSDEGFISTKKDPPIRQSRTGGCLSSCVGA